ncbi:MAG: SAM-dependent methyltransferase [Bacillus sp. (in: firmicutes)]
MTEEQYDQLLNVKTAECQRGFHESFHYHRYEPTPYYALDVLFKRRKLNRSDCVVDFGCGKGRLNFYCTYWFGAKVSGVEMDEGFYQEALENKEAFLQEYHADHEQIEFHHCLAQTYDIRPEDNRFYFFNPFSVQIFMKVVNNILLSVEQHPREVELILYYGSEDYIYFLEDQTAFELAEEIPLDHYEQNANERFLIYALPAYL